LEIESNVVLWITNDVLHFLPKLEKKLKKEIVENLWEIVHNGILHGEGEFGVSACGQFYPQMGYVEIAFYDSGHGIPMVVKQHGALPQISTDSDCIVWAIEKGHSTRPLSESSGLGLHLLRKFITVNGGIFQIASGNGYFSKNGHEEPSVHALRNSIDGTLVNIRVVYDNYLYSLISEHK
ncbi:MAG: hypothetical protein HYZ34_04200, partial [Ignavibacteriae bacterium]|nr:hypothetical protein [Ignavibacteriota bacterium]